ncbi:Mu-like prophage gp37 [Micractinium conductrix]|uniref:Mu-like prophage gp37 n=1 Tax=Micractinium conductrix TaxID=554055 RepID=A0A2P6V623_9CHLO|nr:Mu-like prophage gp37 [Micractinium conductrix]|eukprot:PSC69539.1 Mu-like prophage gp37 [Micractinium conductrix]
MTLTFAPASVKAGMEARDEAMEFQCQQMFDCDGDRRDYAKKQWADFVARDGVPARKAAARSPAASAAGEARAVEAPSE